ncbi:MAG TPA: lytic transglycosylase domain-containing protein [Thermoanaerobaculia bacterium]|nr:lytic transglycosylase domain-containing protein [Thermoanaerobaculia bacterium]
MSRTRRALERSTLLLPLLLVGAGLAHPAQTPAPTVADVPRQEAGRIPPLTPAETAAAAASRAGDFRGVLTALAPASSADGADGRHARLVAGLHAHALERVDAAVRLLAEEPEVPGPLEDWRLWVLADSQAADGDRAEARRTLARLTRDWPESPLSLRARVRDADLAWADGDAGDALAAIAAARARGALGELGERLERLAWEIGRITADPQVRAASARRLLVEFPEAAAELAAVEIFRLPDGAVPWRDAFGPDELMRRAEVLLSKGLAAQAQLALTHVAAAHRTLDWALLRAHALVAAQQGKEALGELAALTPRDPADAVRVELARAAAAFEHAQARSGRHNPPAAERQRLRQRGIEHLERAVELAGDSELAVRPLQELFAELAQGERFEEAMARLKQLRRIASDDSTGSRFLWERGWREYRARNYTGAIGYWSELADLSPRDRWARGSRYWSARAFEALGERQRAQAIYREVGAADTTDFYRRHALARLAHGAAPQPPLPHAAEPWPRDPALERARYLSDLGLEGLALTELELLQAPVERRAESALRGLILARQGRARESMGLLRDAFPALATPHQAMVPPEALALYYPLLYYDVVARWADGRGLPRELVLGVIRQESAFDPTATSHAGARGLMQLMPATARELAGKLGLPYTTESLYQPDYSLQLGTAYLRQVHAMFPGEVELTLAGYNAGPYRIKRLWREAAPAQEIDAFIEGLPLEEPRTYVKRIVLLADSYRQLYPELRGG